jgi:MFS transporter, ACS family, tartrate transporter
MVLRLALVEKQNQFEAGARDLSSRSDSQDELLLRSTVSKASWRLIPLLCVLYLFAYLDRFNVGFASLTMNQDLGISMATYGLATSMFFVGYILFEVPSNLILGKVGARIWIARIMITWGIASASMIFVTGTRSLSVLRFLLGVAEAGFFPGIMIYLTEWFPRTDRARIFGTFQIAMPLSGVLGAPISSLILTTMHRTGGLPGWKWLFLGEGLPSVLLGISCLWLLPSRPRDARWLTPRQCSRLEVVLANERAQIERAGRFTLRDGFTNPRVVVLALMLFCLICGSTGIGLFLPQIVKDLGFRTTENGLVTAVPYLLAVVGMICWSKHSDATRERTGHVAVAAIFAAAGFLLAAFTLTRPAIAMTGISMAAVGVFSSFPVFFTLPTSFLTGTTAAAAIAFINSVGNISGVVEPSILGWTRDFFGGFTLTLVLLSAMLAIAALLLWLFAAMSRRGDAMAVGSIPNADTSRIESHGRA